MPTTVVCFSGIKTHDLKIMSNNNLVDTFIQYKYCWLAYLSKTDVCKHFSELIHWNITNWFFFVESSIQSLLFGHTLVKHWLLVYLCGTYLFKHCLLAYICRINLFPKYLGWPTYVELIYSNIIVCLANPFTSYLYKHCWLAYFCNTYLLTYSIFVINSFSISFMRVDKNSRPARQKKATQEVLLTLTGASETVTLTPD